MCLTPASAATASAAAATTSSAATAPSATLETTASASATTSAGETTVGIRMSAATAHIHVAECALAASSSGLPIPDAGSTRASKIGPAGATGPSTCGPGGRILSCALSTVGLASLPLGRSFAGLPLCHALACRLALRLSQTLLRLGCIGTGCDVRTALALVIAVGYSPVVVRDPGPVSRIVAPLVAVGHIHVGEAVAPDEVVVDVHRTVTPSESPSPSRSSRDERPDGYARSKGDRIGGNVRIRRVRIVSRRRPPYDGRVVLRHINHLRVSRLDHDIAGVVLADRRDILLGRRVRFPLCWAFCRSL